MQVSAFEVLRFTRINYRLLCHCLLFGYERRCTSLFPVPRYSESGAFHSVLRDPDRMEASLAVVAHIVNRTEQEICNVLNLLKLQSIQSYKREVDSIGWEP